MHTMIMFSFGCERGVRCGILLKGTSGFEGLVQERRKKGTKFSTSTAGFFASFLLLNQADDPQVPFKRSPQHTPPG
jgi:hypothetical protein